MFGGGSNDASFWYTRFLESEQQNERMLKLLQVVSESSTDAVTAAYAKGAIDATRSLTPNVATEGKVSPMYPAGNAATQEATPVSVLALAASTSIGRKLFKMGRRKKVALISAFAVMAVAMVSSIAAAIIIYSGSSGSVSQLAIENSTTSAALTVAQTGGPVTLQKSNTTGVPVSITNNTAAPVTPLTWGVTFSTPAQAACASHINYGTPGLSLVSVPASGSNSSTLNVQVMGTLPNTCAGVPVVATITGTTNP